MKVNVGISNRHVHLTDDTFVSLFGDVYLEKERDLNQKGEFASKFKLTIKTDKNIIENVRVMGPYRKYNQVEISKTDAYFLGLNPPVRESGNLGGSEPITLIGPLGEVNLKEGCIIADRHIHINPLELQKYGLEGIIKVKVLIDGEKGAILDNVYIKCTENGFFEMHIDTDDANANLIKNGDAVTIIK